MTNYIRLVVMMASLFTLMSPLYGMSDNVRPIFPWDQSTNIDSSDTPKNFHVVDDDNVGGDDDVDRDGLITLRWNTLQDNGRDVEEYKIIILGEFHSGINRAISSDIFYAFNPLHVVPQANTPVQEHVVDLLGLIGSQFEGKTVRSRYKSILEDMLDGKRTVLYFAVAGSNTRDRTALSVVEPLLGADGRQVVINGVPQVVAKDPISYAGMFFSELKPAIIQLDAAPAKLRLVLNEKVQNGSGEFIYNPKTQLPRGDSRAVVVTGNKNEPQQINLTENSSVSAVYEDGDGILDFSWVKSADGSRPNYPLYHLQISKWPIFTFSADTDYDAEVVNRYFAPEESVFFIYPDGQTQDYLKPDVLNLSNFYNAQGQLERPYLSRNLALVGFNRRPDGSVDYGSPQYRNNDVYGVIDQVNGAPSFYYARVRALGKANTPTVVNQGDLRPGPWSDIVAVRIVKNRAANIAMTITETPAQIDAARDIQGNPLLLPQGQAGLNFGVSSGSVSSLAGFQILTSTRADAVVNGQINSSIQLNKDFSLLDVENSEIGSGTSASPHFVKKLNEDPAFFNSNQTQYYVWVRAFSGAADAVPGPWSNRAQFAIPSASLQVVAPVISRPAAGEALTRATVPLSWTMSGQSPTTSALTNPDSVQYVPYYQVLVYKNLASATAPRQSSGELKFEDTNGNGLNDWEETTTTGGRAYAVYRVAQSQLLAGNTVPYYIPLNEIYNVKRTINGEFQRDRNGLLEYEREVRAVEQGQYTVYMRAYSKASRVSVLSNPGVARFNNPVQPLPQPIVQEPASLDINSANSYRYTNQAGSSQTIQYRLPAQTSERNQDLILQGQIPLNWRLPQSSGSATDRWGVKAAAVSAYEVYAYYAPLGQSPVSPLNADGSLKFEDADQNSVNDYEQINSGQVGDRGKLFALRYIPREALGQGTLTNPYLRFDLFVRTTSTGANGVVFQQAPVGEYAFYIRSVDGGERSLFSTTPMRATVRVPFGRITPNLYLNNITPATDENGIIGLKWQISDTSGQPSSRADKDQLNVFPVYEIQISRSASFSPAAVDYVRSADLMNAQGGLIAPIAPWVRNLNDAQFPLSYRDAATNQEVRLGFVNNARYYMRVRALTAEGAGGVPGPWSNTQSVMVNVQSAPPVPRIMINEQQGSSRVVLPAVENGYRVNVDASGLTGADRVVHYEIWEAENRTPGDYLFVNQLFFLGTSSGARAAFDRSTERSFLPSPYDASDHLPRRGQSYYYVARSMTKTPNFNTPDRVNDAVLSPFSAAISVQLSGASSSASSSASSWRSGE